MAAAEVWHIRRGHALLACVLALWCGALQGVSGSRGGGEVVELGHPETPRDVKILRIADKTAMGLLSSTGQNHLWRSSMKVANTVLARDNAAWTYAGKLPPRKKQPKETGAQIASKADAAEKAADPNIGGGRIVEKAFHVSTRAEKAHEKAKEAKAKLQQKKAVSMAHSMVGDIDKPLKAWMQNRKVEEQKSKQATAAAYSQVQAHAINGEAAKNKIMAERHEKKKATLAAVHKLEAQANQAHLAKQHKEAHSKQAAALKKNADAKEKTSKIQWANQKAAEVKPGYVLKEANVIKSKLLSQSSKMESKAVNVAVESNVGVNAKVQKAFQEVEQGPNKVRAKAMERVSKVKSKPSKESLEKMKAEEEHRRMIAQRKKAELVKQQLMKSKVRKYMQESIAKKVAKVTNAHKNIEKTAVGVENHLLQQSRSLEESEVERSQKAEANSKAQSDAAFAAVHKRTMVVAQAALQKVQAAALQKKQKAMKAAEMGEKKIEKKRHHEQQQAQMREKGVKSAKARAAAVRKAAFAAVDRRAEKQRAQELKAERDISRKLAPVDTKVKETVQKVAAKEKKKKLLAAFLKKKRDNYKQTEIQWAKKAAKKFGKDYDKLASRSAKTLTRPDRSTIQGQMYEYQKETKAEDALAKASTQSIMRQYHAVDQHIAKKVAKVKPTFDEANVEMGEEQHAEDEHKLLLQSKVATAEKAAEKAAQLANNLVSNVAPPKPEMNARQATNGLSELLGHKSRAADADDFISSLSGPA